MFAEAIAIVVAGLLVPPEPEPVVTLALGGDVMLGRLVNATIREEGPRYIWGDTLGLLTGADAALVNLECVIAAAGKRFRPPGSSTSAETRAWRRRWRRRESTT